MTKIFSY